MGGGMDDSAQRTPTTRARSGPPLTVLTSVYNGERYLREAVDSILAQTFGDFEYLILDDGSTDGTREILDSYTDGRIRVVHQENIGLARLAQQGTAAGQR